MSKKRTKEKHIPMRTCIVTHERRPKNELMRIVRLPDGSVEVDPKGKFRGRGANLLPDVEIFDKAIKNGSLTHALKLEKKLSDEQVSDLRKDFINGIEEKGFRKGRRRVTVRVTKLEGRESVDKVEEK